MRLIRFVQIGPSNGTIIVNLILNLNSVQSEFQFSFKEDIDIIAYPENVNMKGPVHSTALQSLVSQYVINKYPNEYPVGICDCQLEDGILSSYDDKAALITITKDWIEAFSPYSIQSGIAYTLVDILVSLYIGTPVHDETRGCPSDYCDNEVDIRIGFSKCDFCSECRSKILRGNSQGKITLEQMVAIYKILDFVAGRRICFVLMPFHERFDRVYTNHIKPILVNHGWECKRADEIYRTREIINIVWEQIRRADLIIADLTGQNPNVFYELGYSHTLGKDTILITQSIDDAPFDLRHRQLIEYSATAQGYQKLSEAIEGYL